MNKNEVRERFRSLAMDSPNRPETARLRDIFDDVEVALNARVPQSEVLAELHKFGFKMNIGAFKSALQRIRKERAKKVETSTTNKAIDENAIYSAVTSSRSTQSKKPTASLTVSKHLLSTTQLDRVGSSITVDSQTVAPSPAVQFQSVLLNKKVGSSVIPMTSDTVESDGETRKVTANAPAPLPVKKNLTVTDRQPTIIEQIEGNECRLQCISEPDITNLFNPRAGVPQEVYLVGDLEHPAVPGLLLSLNQRLSRNLLEIEDHQLVRRNETVKEKQFRISWTKPIPSTPTTTAKDFTEIDFSLFPGTNR